MAAGATNRGRYNIADMYFRGATRPTNYYMALVTNAVTCGVDTNTLSELTQISDGGYSDGGQTVTFDNLTEGSSLANIQVANQAWTPTTSIAPVQAILTDDNVTVGSRDIFFFWDVTGTSIPPGPYTVIDAQIDFAFNSGQWTERGMYEVLNYCFNSGTAPTNLYMALIRATSVPVTTTNVLSDLTQINTGTGYSDGGYTLNLDATDFDTLTENDTNDRAELQTKDLVFTASGDDLDGSGGAGARYSVMTDHDATVANRSVLWWGDLVSNRNPVDGNTLTLVDNESRITI